MLLFILVSVVNIVESSISVIAVVISTENLPSKLFAGHRLSDPGVCTTPEFLVFVV